MTNKEQALTIADRPGLPAQTFDDKQLAMVRDLLTKDLTNAEFGLFIQVCETTGLSPFGKQIYAIKRGGKMTIQTGIDGMRLIAQRSGEYAGQVGPLWCGQDGEWVDVWLKPEHPAAAKVGVLRAGFAEPLWATVLWKNAAQYFNNKLGDMWEKMGDHMLAKNAEAQALRKAFPQELSGLYADVEMPRAPRARRPVAVRVAAELAAENPVAEGVYEAVEEAMSAAPLDDRAAFADWCAGQKLVKPGLPERYLGLSATGDDPLQEQWIDPLNAADYTTAEALELARSAITATVAEAMKLQKAKEPEPLPKALSAVEPLGYRDRAIAERQTVVEAEPVPDDESEPTHPGIGTEP